MNDLRLFLWVHVVQANGSVLAHYSPGMVSTRANAASHIRRRKIALRQRARNEAVASLPASLGARLIRRGQRFTLMLEKSEQTLAHSLATPVLEPARNVHLI